MELDLPFPSPLGPPHARTAHRASCSCTGTTTGSTAAQQDYAPCRRPVTGDCSELLSDPPGRPLAG